MKIFVITFIVFVHAILPCLAQADTLDHDDQTITQINNAYNSVTNVYYGTRGSAGSCAMSGVAPGRFNSLLFNAGAALCKVGTANALSIGISGATGYNGPTFGFKIFIERSNITPTTRQDLYGYMTSVNVSF